MTQANVAGRAEAIARAAARKRLLYARYRGWAEGSKRHPIGLIGPAGEDVVRRSILAAGTVIPEAAGAGEISSILKVKLSGAADSGGHIISLDEDGDLGDVVTTIIEIKNVRDWLYPRSERIYQVLDKVATVQRARPERLIVPILVCRAAAKITFFMAKMLGFLVIDVRSQYISGVGRAKLDEVRNELHFIDLKLATDRESGQPVVDKGIRKRFANMPNYIADFAELWKENALDDDTADLFTQLRDGNLHTLDRDEALNSLRDATRSRLGYSFDEGLGW